MFSQPKLIILSVLFVTLATNSYSNDETFTYPENYDFGERVAKERLATLTASIPPDGEGLPRGTGTFIAGKQVYLNKCEGCHGVDLTGTELGRPLIGGRGSLTTDAPIKTIESYWPYATSIFSYVRDTMPTTAPGSLSNSDRLSPRVSVAVSPRSTPSRQSGNYLRTISGRPASSVFFQVGEPGQHRIHCFRPDILSFLAA